MLSGNRRALQMYRRDSGGAGRDAIEADILTLDELVRCASATPCCASSRAAREMRHARRLHLDGPCCGAPRTAQSLRSRTQRSGSSAAPSGGEEEEQDILGLLSTAAQGRDNPDPLKSLEDTTTTPLQLSVTGKAAVLDLPAYSLSVITAKLA